MTTGKPMTRRTMTRRTVMGASAAFFAASQARLGAYEETEQSILARIKTPEFPKQSPKN
jgi:hypothetical protein